MSAAAGGGGGKVQIYKGVEITFTIDGRKVELAHYESIDELQRNVQCEIDAERGRVIRPVTPIILRSAARAAARRKR